MERVRIDLLKELLLRMDWKLQDIDAKNGYIPKELQKQFRRCLINFGLNYEMAVRTGNYIDLN